MTKLASSVIEVVSATAISIGAFTFSTAAGWVVAGGFGLLFARGLAK